MKKYLLLLLLCVASANLMAQSIPSDSKWYDGWNNYVASDWDEGSVLMQVIAEGEKLEFILVPVEGERIAISWKRVLTPTPCFHTR